jgi:AraC family transcriptional regulator
MQTDKQTFEVNIVDFNQTKLAVLEHRGNLETVFNSVKTFIQWRKLNKLSPKVSQTYNVIYEDPATVAPQDYRIDICASTKTDVKDNEHGVINKTIPAGRCAVLTRVRDYNFHFPHISIT